MDILVGTDPEVFIRNRRTQEFVSAHSYFPGTKEMPFPVRDGAIQVDGVAAEFNITPADNFTDFAGRIASVTTVMRTMLENQDPDLELVVFPTAMFTREYFDSLPEKTKELGCSPDYNAWTKKENEKPTTTLPFRTGAGHIHVGWMDCADVTDPTFIDDCCKVVKTMDASMGVMSRAWDSDRNRRKLYGKKGAYRPKLYGLEYRVLSNMFLYDPAIVSWVFNAAQRSVELALEENIYLERSNKSKQYMDVELMTPNEFKFYNKHLVSFGYEPLPEEIINKDF